jgi:hypothetical protein
MAEPVGGGGGWKASATFCTRCGRVEKGPFSLDPLSCRKGFSADHDWLQEHDCEGRVASQTAIRKKAK